MRASEPIWIAPLFEALDRDAHGTLLDLSMVLSVALPKLHHGDRMEVFRLAQDFCGSVTEGVLKEMDVFFSDEKVH